MRWTLVLLVMALICAVFGFTDIMPGEEVWIARLVFYIFLVLFIIAVIVGAFRRDDT